MNINLDVKIYNNQSKAKISAININSQNQNLKRTIIEKMED